MVIYEVLSGKVPFYRSKVPIVVRRVMEGLRPERPQGEEGELFTDGIWELVELCWKHQPGDRASAEDVVRYLEGAPSLPHPSSNIGVDSKADPDDQSDPTLSGS
ncbi:hypothetical protein BDM02DRAFT_3124488 [Thelephora ganbajun]|uniref:Uncharacterized protein n=1 Tax=Thelephora ganbajun TaxID=370292 RepID=A0ACB6YYM9_THEGA|nr:hypothetical protein BDM02DRAFT_3124488 [Thelephora ganbajun]